MAEEMERHGDWGFELVEVREEMDS